jgi:hypothetical protein
VAQGGLQAKVIPTEIGALSDYDPLGGGALRETGIISQG